uniref:Mannosyltransferase n=1 Tax=Glossina brevipalpis TaxID=37001 RepID=A0A1A9X306_9MUSC
MKFISNINNVWQKKQRPNTDENWSTYLFFAVLRLVLVFIPQLGYVHPDEHFQSVEIVNGDHFHLEHVRTWEFNNTMPMRSMTLHFLLLRIPWSFLEFAAVYIKYYFNKDILWSYTYLVFPRLIYCLLSYLIDWSLYKVCRLYGLKYEIRLLTLGSSWVMLVFGTHTFSNTIEMILCSLLLYYVAECMITTNTLVYKKEFLEEKYDKASSIGERVKIWKLKNSLPSHNFNRLFVMASLCVAGVFNRPTFFLFGAPMVFFWLLRGMGTKTVTFFHFHLRMLLFCLSALPAILVFIICDSLYYRYLTAGEIQMMNVDINNFIFTPWNFIKYNLDSGKTTQHGLHPRYIHLLINIPLLYGILGVIALVTFGQLMIRFFRGEYQALPRAQSIVALMSASIFVPLFFLSLINHQEPRFLIPLSFPIILLHSPKLMTGFCNQYPFRNEHRVLRWFYQNILCAKVSSKQILRVWYITNIILTVFFGFIHQAGVFPLAQHFEQAIKIKPTNQHLHLITSHTYSLPITFINLPSSQKIHFNRQTGQRYKRLKDFYIYEYGSLDLDQLVGKLRLITSHCELKKETKKIHYRIYLAIPTSLSDDLSYALSQINTTYLQYDLKRIFYPHLSTEAFPNIFGRHPCKVDPPNWINNNFEGTCSIEQTPSLSLAYIMQQFSSFVHQFGLALYEFKLRRSDNLSSGKFEKNEKCYDEI